MRMDLGRGAARIRRKDEPRIPRWLHPILEVPLEVKLLGSNLIIVGVAFLLMIHARRSARSIPAKVIAARSR